MPGEPTLISIVMPCYNVAAYVGRAIESVRLQTELPWELVAVDDCSQDETHVLLRAAAEEDPRIRVIELSENGGVSHARNAGLAAVKGTHVAFLDPDDAYMEGLFASLKSALDESDPQVVVWGALERYFDETGTVVMEKPMVCEARTCRNAAEVHKAILDLEKNTLFGYVWNKLYRREVLEASRARFEQAAINEDVYFNIEVAPFVESLTVVDKPLYAYSRRAASQRASLTAQFLPNYFDLSVRRVGGLLQLYRNWSEDSDRVRQVLGTIYARYALSALQRNCDPRSGLNAAGRKAWLEEFYARPITQDLIPYAAPEGKAARIFAQQFQRGSRAQLLFLARVVYAVNRYLPGLFARLRQSR